MSQFFDLSQPSRISSPNVSNRYILTHHDTSWHTMRHPAAGVMAESWLMQLHRWPRFACFAIIAHMLSLGRWQDAIPVSTCGTPFQWLWSAVDLIHDWAQFFWADHKTHIEKWWKLLAQRGIMGTSHRFFEISQGPKTSPGLAVTSSCSPLCCQVWRRQMRAVCRGGCVDRTLGLQDVLSVFLQRSLGEYAMVF